MKLKRVGSNQTAHFPIETPGGDEYHDPLAQAFEINRSQVNGQEQNLQIDIMTEHFIMEFYKIRRKVKKVCDHWEAASVIGELADIPVEIFEEIMNDVLCCFLVHKANVNGITSSSGMTDYRTLNSS